jgi:hypothetical protein
MHTFIDPDDFASLARVLLDLADNKRHVQTDTSHGKLSIVVPQYLYDRWTKYQSLEPSPPAKPKSRS